MSFAWDAEEEEHVFQLDQILYQDIVVSVPLSCRDSNSTRVDLSTRENLVVDVVKAIHEFHKVVLEVIYLLDP